MAFRPSTSFLSTTALLDANVALQLAECAQAYGVTLTQEPIHRRLHELIHALYVRTGERVVVLVDEYDKSVLDHLDRPDVALALREGLRNPYFGAEKSGRSPVFRAAHWRQQVFQSG